jgi:inosine-uridine nucleoside N-ribohydrolase
MTRVFPQLTHDQRQRLLEPPQGPVRVVIDTDAANEVDDQFALAWALLSQDRLKIEGVYAEPYSFSIYKDDLQKTHDHLTAGEPLPESLMAFGSWVSNLMRLGQHPKDLTFIMPEEGMEKSHEEILTVYAKLGLDGAASTYRGAPRYLSSYDAPVRSDAVNHLIECALASDEPLYVIAIGCVTNVASAMLLEPKIVERIVVTWTSGYPSFAPVYNHSFNMEQDMLASKLLFSSGVPLVYLPGYYLGAQLRLSLPEMEQWVRGRGETGDYLYWLYTHNPIHEQRGIQDHVGRTWVIWDLINVAWLLNPSWVPSKLMPTPRLGDDKYWHHDNPQTHMMREAIEIDRDGIFRDFFGKLERAGRTKA